MLNKDITIVSKYFTFRSMARKLIITSLRVYLYKEDNLESVNDMSTLKAIIKSSMGSEEVVFVFIA